jgi:hypothetical protein
LLPLNHTWGNNRFGKIKSTCWCTHQKDPKREEKIQETQEMKNLEPPE